MREQPGVSVILPVYNGEKYLESCLTSLGAQTYRNFEVIIVDDGSTDSSKQIIEEFCSRDSRFYLVEHQHNKGLPSSLNTGAKNASAPLQTWISHDNFLGKDFLQKMMEGFKNSHADIVYSDYWKVDSDSNIFGTSCVEDIENIYCGNVVGASFIYKSCVEKDLGGYNEDFVMFEDYDFFVRAFQNEFKFHKAQIMPYFYRIHNQQLTTTRKMPSVFFHYRLKLIQSQQLRDARVRARAIVSLAHLMLANREFKTLIHLFITITPKDIRPVFRYLQMKLKLRMNSQKT